MIPLKVFKALLKKGWKPQRAEGGKEILDFGKMKIFWHLTFKGHENFACKVERSEAMKILKEEEK